MKKILTRLILSTSFLLASSTAWTQEIALTFDDAPTGDSPLFSGNDRTRAILNHLRLKKVEQAAFFVLTANVTEESMGRLVDYTREGHLLGNHSHSHRRIHEMGIVPYIRDVAVADSILRRFPGYRSWYRYPFLDEGRTTGARDSIRYAISQLGLSNAYVTIDNYDWYLNHLLVSAIKQGKKPDLKKLREIYVDHIYQSVLFYDGVARKQLGRSPRHVLLLHENDLTALFLGDLIDHLQRHGWRIISPAAAYTDPIAAHIPDVLFNGQGRIAAIAREKGILPRELVQDSEDEVYLDTLVSTRGVFR